MSNTNQQFPPKKDGVDADGGCEDPSCNDCYEQADCATCEDQGVIYNNNGDIHGGNTTEEDCPSCATHREVGCPVCPGPVCVKDGNGPEMVYILTYEHKHGSDVGAYRTREGAVAAAYGLAAARVEEDRWEACDTSSDRAKFEAFDDLEAAVDFFNTAELEWNYSESLEITESKLGD